MNKFSKSNHLIINSEEKPILFQLGNYGGIEYTFLNESYEPIKTLELHQNDVLRYSAVIDEIDRIHLVALMKSGELYYFIYEEDNWSNTVIAKLDFRSKIYNNINILIEKNNISIIYSYANLINSNLWTIQHLINNDQNWAKYNVAKFISDRTANPFVIDSDSFNTIHLLYRSIEGDASQIYHIFYNSYAKKWSPTPLKLTSLNTDKIFPYLFVDTKDNLHGIWLEDAGDDYILKYSKLTSKESEKYIWNQIKIPYISNCSYPPIIFEERGILKIVYLKPNNISYIYSLDSGNTWFEGNTFHIEASNIKSIKISNSMLKSANTKINKVYCSIDDHLNIYFSDSFNYSNIISTAPTDNLDQYNKEKEEIDKTNVDIYQLLNAQEEIKNTLYKTLDSQDRIEKKIENILKILETKKSSIFHQFFNS